MSKEEASRIAEAALGDRAVYQDMADREGQFWGKNLVLNTTDVMKQRFAREMEANQLLRAGRSNLSCLKWATDKKLSYEKVLVLGCGTGRLEQAWFRRKMFGAFHGIDIAENAIEYARSFASGNNLPFTYETADLNFIELPRATYDLVVASTALHHCVHLEHIAEQVAATLVPGGQLWLHDYIGESQFQYDGLRVEIINSLIERLPSAYRFNRINERTLPPIAPPKLPLGSPFESIRSEDIAGVFKSRFDMVEMTETTGILHLLAPNGTRSTYAETEEGRVLFEILHLMDDILVHHGVLRPTVGNYVMTAKKPLVGA